MPWCDLAPSSHRLACSSHSQVVYICNILCGFQLNPPTTADVIVARWPFLTSSASRFLISEDCIFLAKSNILLHAPHPTNKVSALFTQRKGGRGGLEIGSRTLRDPALRNPWTSRWIPVILGACETRVAEPLFPCRTHLDYFLIWSAFGRPLAPRQNCGRLLRVNEFPLPTTPTHPTTPLSPSEGNLEKFVYTAPPTPYPPTIPSSSQLSRNWSAHL